MHELYSILYNTIGIIIFLTVCLVVFFRPGLRSSLHLLLRHQIFSEQIFIGIVYLSFMMLLAIMVDTLFKCGQLGDPEQYTFEDQGQRISIHDYEKVRPLSNEFYLGIYRRNREHILTQINALVAGFALFVYFLFVRLLLLVAQIGEIELLSDKDTKEVQKNQPSPSEASELQAVDRRGEPKTTPDLPNKLTTQS